MRINEHWVIIIAIILGALMIRVWYEFATGKKENGEEKKISMKISERWVIAIAIIIAALIIRSGLIDAAEKI